MNLVNYLGKFHPLTVHLPIGILSMFLVLGIFISRDQLKKGESILRLMLFVSAVSATFSSISGYLLASSGSYVGSLVTAHQLLGISLTVFNWIVFLKLKYLLACKLTIYRVSLALIFVFMILTGHAGGSLTHGSDFLAPPPPDQWFSSGAVIGNNIQLSSTAYEAAAVIFQGKCVVCHGPNKQKGELRLDTQEFILKGGESGELITNNAPTSQLIERIMLPLEHEDHMPPRERKQLSSLEISFLSWWVEGGANMTSTLNDMMLPDSLQGILTGKITKQHPFIPEAEIEEADAGIVNQLRSYGVILTSIGSTTNYLSASFVNVLPENSSGAVKLLPFIKNQLITLNLDYQQLDDESWKSIGDLTNLRKLSVKESNLDDQNIRFFYSLGDLVSLNLVGTKISMVGLQTLGNLTNLDKLYIYQSWVLASDYNSLKQLFPQSVIDTGNYIVPILQSDTTVLKL